MMANVYGKAVRKMTRLFATLIILQWMGLQFTHAQNSVTDSLINLLPSHVKEDTTKVNLLNSISWEFHRMDMDEVIRYAEEAERISKEIDYPKGTARAYNLMAIGYSMKGQNEKAISLNEKCLAIGKEINDDYLVGVASNDLGVSLIEKGDYESALKYYHEGLKISIQIKDTLGIAIGNENIGGVHYTMGNIEKAKSYFFDAIQVGEKSSNPFVQIGAYYSLALMKWDAKQMDEANSFLEKALQLSIKANDLINLSNIYVTKAYMEIDNKNNELAEQYAIRAVQYGEQLQDPLLNAGNYLDLSNIYYELKSLEKAKESARKCIDITQEHELLENEMYAYSVLTDIYKEEKNFEKALTYKERFMEIQDSIFNKEKINSITELEEKYKSKQREAENELLKSKAKEQEYIIQRRSYIAIAFGIISLFIGIIGYIYYKNYKSKEKINKELEARVQQRTEDLLVANEDLKQSNMELERFAYITSHDLKEPLRNISSFVKLLERSLKPDPDSREADYMNFIIKNTHQMHQLIEDVLEFSRLSSQSNELQKVDLNDTVDNIKFSISNTLSQKDVNIIIDQPLPVIDNHPTHLHFLFKNLIENGIKYNESQQPTINISYESEPQKHHFIIKDNGIGIEEEYYPQIFEMFKRLHNRSVYEGTGLGLSICKKIISNMNGKIWVESVPGKGSTFHFYIPKTLAA